MKTTTVVKREGEYLGPVDWSFDFEKFCESFYNCSAAQRHVQMLTRALETLHTLEDHLGEYEATTYGGWPRCGWGEVLKVGMYDGWPYWKPVPSVCIRSWIGGGVWSAFSSITDVRKRNVVEGET